MEKASENLRDPINFFDDWLEENAQKLDKECLSTYKLVIENIVKSIKPDVRNNVIFNVRQKDLFIKAFKETVVKTDEGTPAEAYYMGLYMI
ncbi:hypothetical protein HZA39_01750 [Candidatus Peregrinibacteria bacterium]|nr:hypothetical protein [Candidatus Peregrinibacteria bacterium]